MERLRAALIGAGHIGRYHAEKLAACEGVDFAWVVDTDGARAADVAARFGASASDELERVVGDVDLACVAVPTDRHCEVARACLEAGVHVLLEKPIARSLEEADTLIGLAERGRLVLQIGHVERYNGAFRALEQCVRRPLYIEAERLGVFRGRGVEVDVVLDLMIHDIDLALALAGDEVVDVTACGFRVLTADIDIATARLEFERGGFASLTASRVSQSALRKLRVFQPGLYVSADLSAGTLRLVREERGSIVESAQRIEGLDGLGMEVRSFVNAVRSKCAPAVSAEDGRRALALALTVTREVEHRLARHEAAR